jgi:hypothetical protein
LSSEGQNDANDLTKPRPKADKAGRAQRREKARGRERASDGPAM